MEIQVAAYHVRVKERYSSKFQMLDAISGSDDFLEFAERALKKWKNTHHNDEEQGRVAKLQKLQVLDRIVQGRLQVGDYGQACDVIDATEPSRVVFNKGVQHADLLPFFFRLEVPRHRDEALFLIEKSRRTSPKTAFARLLLDQFKAEFPSHTLSINPVMPDQVFRRYLDNGGVQKIEFIKMGLPNDITDILEGGHKEMERATTKLVVTAPRKAILPIKRKILASDDPRKTIGDLYEITDFQYENVAITMRLGRNTRKVDLNNKHAAPLYDITSQVKKGKDGIPTYDSMAAAFESLAADINEGAYASS